MELFSQEKNRIMFTSGQWSAIKAARQHFNRKAGKISELLPEEPEARSLLGNAETVHHEVWKGFDRIAVEIQRESLKVFNDIASTPGVLLPIPIGLMEHNFYRVSDSGGVIWTMDGRGTGKADGVVIDYHGTPTPIAVDDSCKIGWRQMEAERIGGYDMTETMLRNAMRKVAEGYEDMILNGKTSIVQNAKTIYGLRTVPLRQTDVHGLDLYGATGAQWLGVFRDALQKLKDVNFTTPVTFYLNDSDLMYAQTTDYSSAYGNKTIYQRLLELGSDRIASIVGAGRVPTNEVIGLCKRPDVVRILSGMPLTTIPMKRDNPTDEYHIRVMQSTTPQFRWDGEDQCGIVHLTKA